MRSSAGPDAATEGQARARFVADLSACLEDWRRALAAGVTAADPRLRALRWLSQELEKRAAGVGFGGVGHHLRTLLSLLDAGVLDARALGETLNVLQDMREQALQALSPADRHLAAPSAGAAQAGGAALPPPLITIIKRDQLAGPPPLTGGPPPLAGSGHSGPGLDPLSPPVSAEIPALPDFANQRLSQNPGQSSALARASGPSEPPPPLASLGQPDLFQRGASAPPPVLSPVAGSGAGMFGMGGIGAGASFPSASGPPSAPPLPPPVGPLPQSPLGSGSGASQGAGGFAPVPNAPVAGPGAQPNLLVRSMLGLRAFGKPKGKGDDPADAAPPLAGAGGVSSPSTPGILGLGSRKSHRSSPSTPGLPPGLSPGAVAPPPLVADDPSGLPRLPSHLPPRSPATPLPFSPGKSAKGPATGKNQVLDKIKSARDTGPRDVRQPKRKRFSRRPDGVDSDHRVGLVAGIGLAVAVGGIFAGIVLVQTCDKPQPPPVASATSKVTQRPEDEKLPPGGLLSDAERRLYLINKAIREHGELSPELRALLDEEVALRKAELQTCGPEGGRCSARDELAPDKSKKILARKARTVVPELAPKWLAGLTLPSIPVEDDARVEKWFLRYTQSRELKEALQRSIFRCSQYREMVRTKFTRFELPPDLLAVAFWESECRWDAKSKAEAVGMWQFTKAAARAYHLLVIDNTVDERLNPVKATDAAIRYFSDMKKKLGSWDLAFAAYNMGPFGLMARIEQAGGGVSFFDLADAEMIPKETTDYAPAIQAIAVILNNLETLKFEDQRKAPIFTEGLEVPPNTRLTMVARAASTTVRALKDLNRDLLADTTPNVSGFAVQVRPEIVWQAREQLKKFITTRDETDLCLPPETDWNVTVPSAAQIADCQKRREKGAP